MCSTALLTALNRIAKLLMEFIKAEMKAYCPRLHVPEANYARVGSRTHNNKAICTHCQKRGHERRRCYHATRACFECGDTDHFVKHCPLKRVISSLTEPSSSPGSGTNLRPSVIFGMSSRKRRSFRGSRRALEPSRPLPIFDLQCNSSVVDQPGAASTSVDSSSIISCSDSLFIPSSRTLPSSNSQTASRIPTLDDIGRLYMASLDDLKRNDDSSEPGMSVTSPGLLCTDQYRFSVAGGTTRQAILFVLELVVTLVGRTTQAGLIPLRWVSSVSLIV